jgi:YegS/Rv2252/BmrU family lipid kinase
MDSPAIVGITNPRAGNGRARRYARHLERILRGGGLPFTNQYTSAPQEAIIMARDAIAAGARTVLAIGGDGTINEVVNGFLQGGRPSAEVALAIAPVGTGTDFAKTLRQTADPPEVLARLRRNRQRAIDAGLAEFTGLDGRPASRYFVNIAEFGSGGAVVEKVNRTTKVLGGRLSFLLAILSTLPKYRNKTARWRIDGGEWAEATVNNFVVANGRYFGGGLLPAPHAELDDGAFDVVVIGDIDFKTVRRHLGDLRRGTHLGLEFVRSSRGRLLETDRTQRAFLDLDGELVGVDPTRFACLPKALDLVV